MGLTWGHPHDPSFAGEGKEATAPVRAEEAEGGEELLARTPELSTYYDPTPYQLLSAFYILSSHDKSMKWAVLPHFTEKAIEAQRGRVPG